MFLVAVRAVLNPKPQPLILQVGGKAEAVYSADGKWYPCTVDSVQGEGEYHVTVLRNSLHTHSIPCTLWEGEYHDTVDREIESSLDNQFPGRNW